MGSHDYASGRGMTQLSPLKYIRLGKAQPFWKVNVDGSFRKRSSDCTFPSGPATMIRQVIVCPWKIKKSIHTLWKNGRPLPTPSPTPALPRCRPHHPPLSPPPWPSSLSTIASTTPCLQRLSHPWIEIEKPLKIIWYLRFLTKNTRFL
jgi:hypothetical protein